MMRQQKRIKNSQMMKKKFYLTVNMKTPQSLPYDWSHYHMTMITSRNPFNIAKYFSD